MKKLFLLSLVLMFIAVVAFASNPCTVDSTQVPDGLTMFATVQSAIASWCAGGTNAAQTPPFIINVVPVAATYNERLTLDDIETGQGNIIGDIIIQSSVPGTYAYIALQQGLATVATTSGCRVFQKENDVTFKDILFMPSIVVPIMGAAGYWFWIDENPGASLMDLVTFDHCLFTQINAGGIPLITTRTAAYTAGIPYVPPLLPPVPTARMISFYPDPTELKSFQLNDCTFYGSQGYTVYCALTSNTDTAMVNNCCFAWTCSGYQVRFAGNAAVTVGAFATVTGTDQTAGPDNCTVFIQQWSGDNHNLYLSGGNNFCNLTLEKSILAVVGPDLLGAGTDTRNFAGSGTWNANVSDCILYSESSGFGSVLGTNIVPVTYNRVTFHKVTGTNIYGVGGTASQTCRDCIFSGAGCTVWGNSAPTGGIDVNYCAYAEGSGPDIILGRGTIQTDGLNITSADPIYLGKDWKLANFMDVDSAWYGGKGTAASNLAGGADYVGGTPIGDWTIY